MKKTRSPLVRTWSESSLVVRHLPATSRSNPPEKAPRMIPLSLRKKSRRKRRRSPRPKDSRNRIQRRRTSHRPPRQSHQSSPRRKRALNQPPRRAHHQLLVAARNAAYVLSAPFSFCSRY